jgi:hypothetical protein
MLNTPPRAQLALVRPRNQRPLQLPGLGSLGNISARLQLLFKFDQRQP